MFEDNDDIEITRIQRLQSWWTTHTNHLKVSYSNNYHWADPATHVVCYGLLYVAQFHEAYLVLALVSLTGLWLSAGGSNVD